MGISDQTLQKNELCLIIPTRNRPQLLLRLFESIKIQEVYPEQLIVVDGSDVPIKDIIDKINFIKIDYVRVYPPGLTKQRNEGLKNVEQDIKYIGFLDDDIVLKEHCIKNLVSFWKTADSGIAGCSLNIEDFIDKRFSLPGIIYDKIFCSGTKIKGKILKSGINSNIFPAEKMFFSKWLCGGATIYRKEIFQKYKYDEWYTGYGIVEDVEISYRISKEYKLVVLSDAKVCHIEDVTKKNFYNFGQIHTVNRFYFVRKNKEFSVLLCAWASFGIILRAYIDLFRRGNNIIDTFKYSLGILDGIFQGVTGRLKRISKDIR